MATAFEDQLRQTLGTTLAKHASMSATELVQTALRVAILRDDPLAESWLRVELHGATHGGKSSPELRECHSRLAALVGTENAREQVTAAVEAIILRRSSPLDGTDAVQAQGIGELEALHRATREIHDAPVTPGMTPIDTGLASISRDRARVTTTPLLMQQALIIERVKQAAFEYLVRVESEIIRGQSVPDTIAKGRLFVDAKLAVIAPDALDALTAAQDRLAQDENESFSHAATSCRRAIKSLADALYPPTSPILDANGVSRVMDDEHYRNRLTQYVRSHRGKSTHADLLASNIVSLGTRLKSLDDLASKGVHSDLHRSEAESCVTWTYMLAADLLRVEDERDRTTDAGGDVAEPPKPDTALAQPDPEHAPV